MATCGKCERILPANGNCLYCGNLEWERSGKGTSGTMKAWINYGVKFGIAVAVCSFAYWLIFKPGGIAFRESIHAKFSSKPDDSEDPKHIQMLKKYPQVREMLTNKLNWQVEDVPLATGSAWRQVSVIRRGTTDITQCYIFRVNPDSGEIQGGNTDSQQALR